MSGKTTLENKHLYAFGPFRLDAAERRLLRDGEIVPLPRKAFNLLLLLVADAGRLQTREALIEALWPGSIVEEQGLSARVHVLRRELGDEGETSRYIETVRGVGYRFIAPVEVESPVSAELPSPPVERGSSRHWLKPAIGSAAAVIVVVAGLIAWYFVAHPPDEGMNSAARPSVAVLPFKNLSADPANAYFAAGIQDEILTRLAAIGSLKVIARTSTASYTSHPRNLKAIARQLGVATVLEGSVQKIGNKVHINVQLIDARTLAHIWAKTYDRKLDDIFGVEERVAQTIADSLRARLKPPERVRLARAPTRDPEAYSFYLRANYYADRVFNRTNVNDRAAKVRKTAALYRKAIARDPEFALAWTQLSMLQSRAWWFDIAAGNSERVLAAKAAKQALALNPSLPQAHLAMGYVDYFVHMDYAAALVQFQRAREKLPNDADAAAAIAYVHRRQGKWQQALEELEAVIHLDPRNPRRHYEIGLTLATLRRYAAAEQQLNEALAIEPQDYITLAYKIRLLFLAGKTRAARAELATVPAGVDPQGSFSSLHFESAWLARQPEQALAAIASAPTWVQSTNTLSPIPANLLRGEALSLEGKTKRARQAYADAREKLQASLRNHPDNPPLLHALGVAEAGLGEEQKAIQAGLRATRLLPISKDAYYGVVPLTVLAKIYAQTGEPGKALDLLRRLLDIPSGEMISLHLLRLDPVWDPLRKDPRFQALLRVAPAPDR